MPLAAKMTEQAPIAPVREKLHLSSREVPPGGLRYKIEALAESAPQAAWVGPFNSVYDLMNEVRLRCKANGIPAPSEADVEDQICQRCPPGYCRDALNRPTFHPGSLSLSLPDVITGTKALLNWFRHGSVETEEIVRRTAICNACPENQLIQGCQGCAANSLHQLMNAIVVRPLASDAVLHACNVCKCSLKAKVRMRLDDLPPMTPDQLSRLPESCWIVATPSARDSDPRV